MTRLEEAVWAAQYVHMLEIAFKHKPMTRVDLHAVAVQEADAVIMAMRRGVEYRGERLHEEDQLERERVGADVPLYRGKSA